MLLRSGLDVQSHRSLERNCCNNRCNASCPLRVVLLPPCATAIREVAVVVMCRIVVYSRACTAAAHSAASAPRAAVCQRWQRVLALGSP